MKKSISDFMSNPRNFRRFHGYMTILWALLIVPSLMLWKNSILWIVLMSAWANFASHFSAWQASRAETREKDRQEES